MSQITKIKSMYKNNGKVIENYFFMTAMQLINTLFGILIYPFLIRVLGAHSYGLFVFALSVSNYFIIVVSFGFNLPALKLIAENKDNIVLKNNVMSAIFTAKFFIAIFATIVFYIFAIFIPQINENLLLFSLVFGQIIASVIFPSWYFQGVQKMKIPTLIQFGTRILSLPFTFFMINNASDIIIYAYIFTLSNIFSALLCMIYLYKYEDISYTFVKFSIVKKHIKDATAFFGSSSAGVIKEESVNVIIGSMFGMTELAYYNLAEKIVRLPRMFTMNINEAIFPKFISDKNERNVRKIIKYEVFVGLIIIIFIAVFGRWAILLLGGVEMLSAYPMAIILSITILVWLIVGSYISFVFIPAKKYFYVTQNQFIALISFLLFYLVGYFISKSIFVVIIAITLSGICEILYCNYLIKKHKMI